MRKIKYSIIFLIILGSLLFIFSPDFLPENLEFKEFLDSTEVADVFIIFNSGGWGYTPLQSAKDFAPIMEGIQETLNEWGFNSIIVTYLRTKNNLLGKITATKEMALSFQGQSEKLAKDIEEFLEQNPGKKIIIAGLCSGAVFANQIMEKLSAKTQNAVFVIGAGIPLWEKPFNSENILYLDNEGKDPLSKGEIKILISTLLESPFKWLSAKISGNNFTFSQAFQVPGHEYFWDSPEVGPQIVNFLEDKIR